MDINAEFGEAVAVLRKRAGMTQQELATLSGVHYMTISGIERLKRKPYLDTAVRLAGVLDMSLDAMVERPVA